MIKKSEHEKGEQVMWEIMYKNKACEGYERRQWFS